MLGSSRSVAGDSLVICSVASAVARQGVALRRIILHAQVLAREHLALSAPPCCSQGTALFLPLPTRPPGSCATRPITTCAAVAALPVTVAPLQPCVDKVLGILRGGGKSGAPLARRSCSARSVTPTATCCSAPSVKLGALALFWGAMFDRRVVPDPEAVRILLPYTPNLALPSEVPSLAQIGACLNGSGPGH